MAASGGEPERLTVGGNDATWPSVSRKGNRLAYTFSMKDANVWRMAAPGAAGAGAPIAAPMRISQSPSWDMQPAFSPDGRKIAWISAQSGVSQIWLSNSDGSQPSQLTNLDAPGSRLPRWSPDGRQIAFNGSRRGRWHVCVIGAEGGASRQLTSGTPNELVRSWPRDSKWVYYAWYRNEGSSVWKVPAGGGSPVLVTREGWDAFQSSDGRFVYYTDFEGSVWKAPTTGGATIRVVPMGWKAVESLDGNFLYYRVPGRGIWKAPVAGGQQAPVLKTHDRALWALSAAGLYALDPDAEGGPAIEFVPFAEGRREVDRLAGKRGSYQTSSELRVSPDGRWLLYAQIDRDEADIMLVENFRMTAAPRCEKFAGPETSVTPSSKRHTDVTIHRMRPSARRRNRRHTHRTLKVTAATYTILYT